MAIEKSPYEKLYNGGTGNTNCLGRIVSVDVEARTCRVKTIGSKTNDLDLHNVQWIAINASTTGEGNEDTCIPEPGAQGVVIFIGNAPYIVGYFRPLKTPKEAGEIDPLPDPALENEPSLSPGDRIIKTVAGNKIILLSGGAIVVESNGRCKTIWSPAENRITNTCNNYEIETSGGFEYWTADKESEDTTKDRTVWDNLSPTFGIRTQEGASDTGSILRQTAGELDDDLEISEPAYDYQIDAAGKELKKLDLLSIEQIGPDDGSYATTKDIENEQASFTTPSGHCIVIDDSDDDGSITITHRTGAQIQITGKGDIILQTGSGNTISYGNSGVGMTSKQGGTVDVSDSVTISDKSGKQMVTIDGTNVNILSGTSVVVQAPTVQIKGSSIDLGDNPSYHAVIYEMLKSIFDGHIHGSGVGPTSPPLPPNTMGMMELTPATSAQASYVKIRGNLVP